jgi:hypothetical protein
MGKGDKEDQAIADRAKRDASRAARRASKKREENEDIMKVAARDLAVMQKHQQMAAGSGPNSVPTVGEDEQDDQDLEAKGRNIEKEEKDPNKFFACIDWLMEKPRQPPPEWQTFRREELQTFISDMRFGFLSLMPKSYDTLLFQIRRNRRVRYWGDRDSKGRRDGRGICLWPDPPSGGGESYFGLWREDHPNGHGMPPAPSRRKKNIMERCARTSHALTHTCRFAVGLMTRTSHFHECVRGMHTSMNLRQNRRVHAQSVLVLLAA